MNSLFYCRFSKKERIITAHYQTLLDLEAPSNAAYSLRRFYDEIESHIRGLESLGKSKDLFGDFLVPVVYNKLPQVIKWNLTRNHTLEEWNIDELQDAIDKEILVLESGSDSSDAHKQSTVTGSFHAGIHKGQLDKKVVSSKPMCVYCKGYHVSVYCDVVTNIRAQMNIVKKEGLCFNRLDQHKASHCNSRSWCKRYHRKHHTSLCETPTSGHISKPQETQSSSPQSSL